MITGSRARTHRTAACATGASFLVGHVPVLSWTAARANERQCVEASRSLCRTATGTILRKPIAPRKVILSLLTNVNPTGRPGTSRARLPSGTSDGRRLGHQKPRIGATGPRQLSTSIGLATTLVVPAAPCQGLAQGSVLESRGSRSWLQPVVPDRDSTPQCFWRCTSAALRLAAELRPRLASNGNQPPPGELAPHTRRWGPFHLVPQLRLSILPLTLFCSWRQESSRRASKALISRSSRPKGNRSRFDSLENHTLPKGLAATFDRLQVLGVSISRKGPRGSLVFAM